MKNAAPAGRRSKKILFFRVFFGIRQRIFRRRSRSLCLFFLYISSLVLTSRQKNGHFAQQNFPAADSTFSPFASACLWPPPRTRRADPSQALYADNSPCRKYTPACPPCNPAPATSSAISTKKRRAPFQKPSPLCKSFYEIYCYGVSLSIPGPRLPRRCTLDEREQTDSCSAPPAFALPSRRKSQPGRTCALATTPFGQVPPPVKCSR